MKSDRLVTGSTLAAITGIAVHTIENLYRQNATPWPLDTVPRGRHHRYGAFHALAMVLHEMLRAQGLTHDEAGEAVRTQSNVLELFLGEIEGGAPVTPRFVALIREGQVDSWTGPRWCDTHLAGYGTAEEIGDAFRGALAHAGRVYQMENGRTVRNVSGPWMVVQSIPVAWDVLADRAATAGYRIRGRSIIPARAPDEADE